MAKLQPSCCCPPARRATGSTTLGSPAWRALQGALGLPRTARSLARALLARPAAARARVRAALRDARDAALTSSIAAARAPRTWREELAAQWHAARTPFRAGVPRRTLIVALLWNCVHLLTAPSVAYWVIYAREELGLSRERSATSCSGATRRARSAASPAGCAARPHRPQGDLRGLLHARRHRARAALPHRAA